jgi:hypothetical protein
MASRIRSATSSFGAFGTAVSALELTRVTAFSRDSKPIAGSETSFRTIRSAPLRVSLARARASVSPPCSAAKPTIV